MENSVLTEEDIQDLFGGEAGPVKVNQDELAVSLVLSDVRAKLANCADRLGLGNNELSRRLNVSPSSVSRFFASESDAKISTVVLYARSMGHECSFSLSESKECAAKGNHLDYRDFRLLVTSPGAVSPSTPIIRLPDTSTSTSITTNFFEV